MPHVLWWLSPPLIAVVLAILATTYVGRRRERHGARSVMHSNYVESQRRRRERLSASGYMQPLDNESVRVLPSSSRLVGKPGRHRRG